MVAGGGWWWRWRWRWRWSVAFVSDGSMQWPWRSGGHHVRLTFAPNLQPHFPLNPRYCNIISYSYCNSPDFQGVSGIVGIGLPLPQVTFHAFTIITSNPLYLFHTSDTRPRYPRDDIPQHRHAAATSLPAHGQQPQPATHTVVHGLPHKRRAAVGEVLIV